MAARSTKPQPVPVPARAAHFDSPKSAILTGESSRSSSMTMFSSLRSRCTMPEEGAREGKVLGCARARGAARVVAWAEGTRVGRHRPKGRRAAGVRGRHLQRPNAALPADDTRAGAPAARPRASTLAKCAGAASPYSPAPPQTAALPLPPKGTFAVQVGDAAEDLADDVGRVLLGVVAALRHTGVRHARWCGAGRTWALRRGNIWSTPHPTPRMRKVPTLFGVPSTPMRQAHTPPPRAAPPPGRPRPHRSSSSPPVTSSVTMYTLRGVMYTAYSLMQLGWSTCGGGPEGGHALSAGGGGRVPRAQHRAHNRALITERERRRRGGVRAREGICGRASPPLRAGVCAHGQRHRHAASAPCTAPGSPALSCCPRLRTATCQPPGVGVAECVCVGLAVVRGAVCAWWGRAACCARRSLPRACAPACDRRARRRPGGALTQLALPRLASAPAGTLMATSSPLSLSRPRFTTAKPAAHGAAAGGGGGGAWHVGQASASQGERACSGAWPCSPAWPACRRLPGACAPGARSLRARRGCARRPAGAPRRPHLRRRLCRQPRTAPGSPAPSLWGAQRCGADRAAVIVNFGWGPRVAARTLQVGRWAVRRSTQRLPCAPAAADHTAASPGAHAPHHCCKRPPRACVGGPAGCLPLPAGRPPPPRLPSRRPRLRAELGPRETLRRAAPRPPCACRGAGQDRTRSDAD